MSDDRRPVLLLPGWQDSGPGHWQTRWEHLHGHRRVEQSDWFWPRRGDWMAQLEEAVLRLDAPALLVAHSLGCHLAAAWAAHLRHTARVAGALLVALPDVARDDTPPQLHPWRPAVRERLPFPAIAVLSTDDPFASIDTARTLATDWGARIHIAGPLGHLNGDSGLGDWPAGHALLSTL